jgi:outer membrane protein insertion porin family
MGQRITFVLLILLVGLVGRAGAQGVDATGRPVAEIRIVGVSGQTEQLVRNQITLRSGDPFDQQVVAQDIQNLTRLGRFSQIFVDIEPNDDGSVDVIYRLTPQQLLSDVQVVGNKALDDEQLLEAVLLRPGDAQDDYLIQHGRRQIIEKYREAGHYLADVQVDEEMLSDNQVLIYRVREGPRVKVRGVRFDGNETFTARQLKSKIRTRPYMFIFEKGELSEEQLQQDVGRLRDFYEQRGYLEARVGRRVELSADQKDAVVVFMIDEGPQYTVASIDFDIRGQAIFPEQEMRQAMQLNQGDVYSVDRVRGSVEALENLYGRLGYLMVDRPDRPIREGGSTTIAIERSFHADQPKVDLVVRINEGKPYTVGNVVVRGNMQTRDKVVRRQLRGLEPGRRFDRPSIEHSQKRLTRSALFREADITVQGEPEQTDRDVLVEVKEARTGSLSFGAAVSSDAGLLGAIDFRQRNFDIADWPRSWGELFSGQAFRGAGQTFAVSIQPGNRVSLYSVSFSEPYLNDSDYFLNTSLFLRQRDYEEGEGDFDEERLGGSLGLGKRFGDVWSASIRADFEQIEISEIASDAPVDVFAVEGDNQLDSLGLYFTRNTTDDRIFPTRGSILTFGVGRTGVITDDFQFTRATVRYRKFWTVDEDFFGRKTIFSARVESGLILEEDEAPIFERFYAGGHRSFRGFRYRGVGPRGIRNDTRTVGDDPVGGDWMFLFGMEYNFPIVQEYVRGVFFMDSGTVEDDLSFDEYRVSLGGGVRLIVPFLGQAPFAFDLAYPIVKEEFDEQRLFSFSVDLPF